MAQVIQGDCLDELWWLEDDSVDAIVTDPPYGISFMGKAWDGPGGMLGQLATGLERAVSGPLAKGGTHSRRYADHDNAKFEVWCAAWATECLRVLKPGGHLLAFGGTRTWHRLTAGIEDAGFEIRDSIAWMYGSGFPKSRDLAKQDMTGDDAEKWAGWGTALKPAFEPIVVARKPVSEKTLAANVLRHGTGALNIDASRLGGDNPSIARRQGSQNHLHQGGSAAASAAGVIQSRTSPERYAEARPGEELGRWPTNVALDEEAAGDLDLQAPKTGAAARASGPTLVDGSPRGVAYGARNGTDRPAPFHADLGGASRFMYVAKAPKSERPVVDGHAHPTVKPLALMRWLVRMVTPPGGTVLDPFAGSGATVEACILEGFDYVAIEREAEYIPLIEARIARQS